jgi:hypothetical protein
VWKIKDRLCCSLKNTVNFLLTKIYKMEFLCVFYVPLRMQYSRVQIGEHLSDIFPIKNGLKQGDALSHCFSNLL